MVRSGDYYLFETDSEEEEEEDKKQEKENKKEDLREKSAFQVRFKVIVKVQRDGVGGKSVDFARLTRLSSSVRLSCLDNRLQNSNESSQQPEEVLEKEFI